MRGESLNANIIECIICSRRPKGKKRKGMVGRIRK